ncbi:hypothetical protein ES703_107065 [subsurface metagenome]
MGRVLDAYIKYLQELIGIDELQKIYDNTVGKKKNG